MAFTDPADITAALGVPPEAVRNYKDCQVGRAVQLLAEYADGDDRDDPAVRQCVVDRAVRMLTAMPDSPSVVRILGQDVSAEDWRLWRQELYDR